MINPFVIVFGFLLILYCLLLIMIDLHKIKKRLGMIGNIRGKIFEKEEEEITLVVGKTKFSEELAKEISSSLKNRV